MTTSDYLKVQTTLLVALDSMRGLPLEDFIQKAREVADRGGELLDHRGQAVVTDATRMARLATGFRDLRHAARKGMASAAAPRLERIA